MCDLFLYSLYVFLNLANLIMWGISICVSVCLSFNILKNRYFDRLLTLVAGSPMKNSDAFTIDSFWINRWRVLCVQRGSDYLMWHYRHDHFQTCFLQRTASVSCSSLITDFVNISSLASWVFLHSCFYHTMFYLLFFSHLYFLCSLIVMYAEKPSCYCLSVRCKLFLGAFLKEHATSSTISQAKGPYCLLQTLHW